MLQIYSKRNDWGLLGRNQTEWPDFQVVPDTIQITMIFKGRENDYIVKSYFPRKPAT